MLQLPGDIEDVVKKQKEKAFARHQTVQPYLCVQGTSFESASNFYIVLDDIYLQFNNAKKAFDTLFKLFHTFNLKYPLQSEHLYLLIQKAVYEIHLNSDNVPPYIFDVLKQFAT